MDDARAAADLYRREAAQIVDLMVIAALLRAMPDGDAILEEARSRAENFIRARGLDQALADHLADRFTTYRDALARREDHFRPPS